MAIFSGPEIPNNGLVLHLDAANSRSYPGSGTTWTDLSGSGNNGTLTNGPTYNSARGGSIIFDGVNDNTNFGNVYNLGTNNLTVNIWFKQSATNTLGVLLSKAFYGPQSYRYNVNITDGKFTAFFQGNGGGDVAPSGNTLLNVDAWYMGTAVFNRSSNISLFINGVPETISSGSTAISQWNNLNFQSTNPFRVGSYTYSDNIAPNLVFNGSISNVQMYFRTLSAAEIQQNFEATRGRYGI